MECGSTLAQSRAGASAAFKGRSINLMGLDTKCVWPDASEALAKDVADVGG